MPQKFAKNISKAPQGKKGKGCLVGCLTILGILIVLFVGLEIFRRSAVRRMDEAFLTTYQPGPEIADIAEKTVLSDKAKKIFYRADPEFIETDKFTEYCALGNGIELALACARSNTPGEKSTSRGRIFLLQITDPEFVDSKYPSAAHEILHVAYHQLATDEKERVDALIDLEREKYKDDPHIAGLVDILKNAGSNRQEAARDELHSVFGVEYRDLSPELENYYAQYFRDRNQIVAMHVNSGLTKRIKRLEQLSQETKALDVQLTALSAELKKYEKTGATGTYNSLAQQFNGLVNQYNAKAGEGKKLFGEINTFYQLMNPSYRPPEEKGQ